MKILEKYNEIPSREYEEDILVEEILTDSHRLVLHNDDFNTFDFVIECLIEICGHTEEQAQPVSYTHLTLPTNREV